MRITEQNRTAKEDAYVVIATHVPAPRQAVHCTTGRRRTDRHLLGRLRVCRSLTQSVREGDCWFGAWHGATHSYPQHARPKQWKNYQTRAHRVAGAINFTMETRGKLAHESSARNDDILSSNTTRNWACRGTHGIARTVVEAQGAMSAGGSVRSAVDLNIACNSLVLVNLCRGTNGCGRRAWWK